MAKSTVKNTTAPVKKSTTTTKAKAKASPDALDKLSEETLKKFQSLGIEQQLQADLEWCLGSYRHDKNPSGLLGMMSRALDVLRAEQTKKTKGVTAKLITDLEKALKA
jgi:formate-dependent nitrite reductase cytochrome c552 subunit